MTFVVHGKDPEAFLDLIRSTPKTVIQTGQVGAILLADALVVRVLFAFDSVASHTSQTSAHRRSTAR